MGLGVMDWVNMSPFNVPPGPRPVYYIVMCLLELLVMGGLSTALFFARRQYIRRNGQPSTGSMVEVKGIKVEKTITRKVDKGMKLDGKAPHTV